MKRIFIILFSLLLLFITVESNASPRIIEGLNVGMDEFVVISPEKMIDSSANDLAIYGELEIDGGDEGIILSPRSSLKHIYLDPDVKNVIVIPAEYDFSEEVEEFAKWRRRYGTYWLMFELMRYSTKTLQ